MHRVPTTSQLLNTWELGRAHSPVQRAQALLALAVPSASAEDLARYSIGRRDRELLDLRGRLFGARLTGTAQCPACGASVDLDFAVSDLRSSAAAAAEVEQSIREDGYEVQFRLPTLDDLASLEHHGDPPGLRAALLDRCVTAARRDGAAVTASALPENVTALLSDRMAKLDPEGDIQLSLSCPNCAQHWHPPLDIASYLWAEIETWAMHLLRDVHVLASTYGWRETDILNLSPWRRQVYLEMIGS
jgi:hypothetical protein